MHKSTAVWSYITLILLALCLGACSQNDTTPSQPAGSTGTPSNQDQTPGSSSNEPGNEPGDQPVNEGDTGGDTPKIVASNDTFQIYQPAPDSIVGQSFVVKGKARVFEATLNYSFEDGHQVLAEGFTTASMGAPEWGDFSITVKFDKPTSPTGVLTIFEASAKDGSPIHQLHIPLKFDKSLIQAK
ncbi:Gmad2 immunoglobulin-like domain-containing protein [Paenibacillus solisilvae]|uniref:Gmad2 immunoglobulin-like domain-containing protein n=1 Tax=Paenibacillus solisilvae TaxID=2486751 RepID=A0ABW0W7D8_9BACL